jgi:chromosome segregation ATPase
MSANRRPAAKSTRLVWAIVAGVLLLLLAASFVLAGRAVEATKADAQVRAERYAVSGLSGELTADVVRGDIVGPEYRDLLSRVQSGITSDERVVRVRIWKPDGDLIFSTGRDDVEQFVAVDHPQIQQAAEGQTASAVSDATDAPLAGLEGSDEKLFVTYVPMQFPSEAEPSAVTEIAQRYSAIQEEALRLWRPVQIGLAVALGGIAVLFAISQRRSKGTTRAAWVAKPARESRDDRKLRDAENRAAAAERAARLAEERLSDAEQRLEVLDKAEVAPEIGARIEELELKLRAERAEREQFAGEAKRLRSALSEREAELALAREGTASREAEKVRSVDAVQRAEQQTADAERRAAAAGGIAAEAEAKAAAAALKVAELEAALRDADRRIEGAVADARRSAEEAQQEEVTRVTLELRTAQLEANDLKLKLSELESSLRDAEAGRAEGEAAASELARLRGEIGAELVKVREEADAEIATARGQAEAELVRLREDADRSRSDLDVARLELERSRLELESTREELEAIRGGREAWEGEVAMTRDALGQATTEQERLRGELERAAAEQERLRAELERSSAEQDRLRGEVGRVSSELERNSTSRGAVAVETLTGEAAGEVAELEERVARVEAQRREEVAELQRVQESFANAQLEMMETTRKLRAAEERVHELEGAGAGGRRRPETAYPVLEPEEPPPSFDRPSADDRPDASFEPEPEEEPQISEEGLSLRERLARAAAARHRTSQTTD